MMAGIPGFNFNPLDPDDVPHIGLADLGSDPLSAIDALFPMTAAGYKDYALEPAIPHKASKTWTKVNPMASLSYTLPHDLLRDSFVDSAMAYITYAEGFKSGTFEPFGNKGLRSVDPEVVKNHEVGLKLDGFDRRVRLNLAAYYMKYDDMQLRQVQFDEGSPVVVLANASKSEIKGAELELTWQPTAGLLVNLGSSYNRYKFKSFDDYQFSTADLLGGGSMPYVDRSKETFPEVPKKTFNFGVQYDWVTDFGTIRPRVDYHYRSEVYLGLDAGAWNVRKDSTVGSAGLVNARLASISPKQDWESTLGRRRGLGRPGQRPAGLDLAQAGLGDCRLGHQHQRQDLLPRSRGHGGYHRAHRPAEIPRGHGSVEVGLVAEVGAPGGN